MTTSNGASRGGAARRTNSSRRNRSTSFRVGKVRGDRRGDVWYLTYHEDGRRHRPRIGPDRNEAEQHAAQINAQLTMHVPVAFSFQSISISELRDRWLEHHEHVARSSVQTIRRYRAATEHLISFVNTHRVPAMTGKFAIEHAEEFAKYLRSIRVSPNGHPRSKKRPLLDKGVQYILECCRSLFAYAIKCRHLPPYVENPFSSLRLSRSVQETSRPIVLFTLAQEREFLLACDEWQFPIFLTLMLTGLRPGELTHLLLADDVDWESKVLRITNKPALGWQVKTRNTRDIPLVDPLVDVLRQCVGDRKTGPVFRRRRFLDGERPLLDGADQRNMEHEIIRRMSVAESERASTLSRAERLQVCRQVWRDGGMVKTDRIRIEFIRVCRRIGLNEMTCPKMLRHLFATCLQDANVDPLVRNEVMGHVAPGQAGGGLAMTAVYTHTRPETKRQQLIRALELRPAWAIAREWLASHTDENRGP